MRISTTVIVESIEKVYFKNYYRDKYVLKDCNDGKIYIYCYQGKQSANLELHKSYNVNLTTYKENDNILRAKMLHINKKI